MSIVKLESASPETSAFLPYFALKAETLTIYVAKANYAKEPL